MPMKYLPVVAVVLSVSLSGFAQDASPAKKSSMEAAKSDASEAAKAVGDGTKKIAKDAASTVEGGVKATGNAVKSGADAAATGVGTAVKVTEKTAGAVVNTVKAGAEEVQKVSSKVVKQATSSDLFKKIEKEAGKPMDEDQRQKFADAWQKAKAKSAYVEEEFSNKVEEITGVAKKKTKEFVKDLGL